MKWIATLLILTLVSCKEISFKEPQPKGKKALKEVPAKIRGKYLISDDEGNPSKDTLIITKDGYRFGYYDPEQRMKEPKGDEALLSDSLVLKQYRGYYFVNLAEDPEWLLRVIKREENGDISLLSMEPKDESFNAYLRKLATEIKIDSTEVNNEKLYQIDPTPKQLVDLVKKGYFSKSLMKKINK